MDDAIADVGLELATADDAGTVQLLPDTIRASRLACLIADEVVRDARHAIAMSQQLLRSAEQTRLATQSAWAHRAKIRAEFNGGPDHTGRSPEPDPQAADF
jgi:hypothetical protein